MPLSEAAKALFDWNDDSPHAPIETVVEGNTFRTPCRCGYKGKPVTSSPSHSWNSTRVHVTNENRREAEGGQKVAGDAYTASGTLPRAMVRAARPAATAPGASSRPSVGSPRASRGTPGTPCGCGCGEPSGGLFRPGHDSKLLSRLLGEIRAGTKTLEQAHKEMADIGTSEVLREKLAKKVNA
ncbi:hypothetical protein SEA_GALACTICA_37 [Streptomyces phage Galactica]|nr:hypothetical protein SEA_GALACTICA_37 [Streptomyces phage Galactica]